jgi:hypothetical protein
MYNLTIVIAHTYFVGDGQWLVHNCFNVSRYKPADAAALAQFADEATRVQNTLMAVSQDGREATISDKRFCGIDLRKDAIDT